jgi:ABC-2 type transport system permease protein
MHKYWQLFLITWQQGMVYRTSILLWRFRQLLATVMPLTVWSVLYTDQTVLFGYQRSEMITYILLVSVLQSLILATSWHGLAHTVYSGSLSKELLKPINIYLYLWVYELTDKLKNLFFVLLESALLFVVFQPVLTLPSAFHASVFVVWLLLAILLHFAITILFGTLGFWTPDVWAPKFLFFIFVDFTAGKLFPLDILPQPLIKLLYLTPFPYLSYAQSQLFLNKVSTTDIIINTLAILFWTVAFGVGTHLVWQRGLKDYTAAGQ